MRPHVGWFCCRWSCCCRCKWWASTCLMTRPCHVTYSVWGKRDQNVLWISSVKLGNFDKILYTVFWLNLLQNRINVFQLTWIMSLHYLVKLEMRITHVLPSSCYTKKLQYLSDLNCGLQIQLDVRSGCAIWWMLTGEGLVWLIGAMVCSLAAVAGPIVR